MNQVIKNDEDNLYGGEVMFQWLHANARNMESEENKCYVATVTSEGRAGMLQLQLVSTARESATGKIVHAESLLEFGDEPVTRTLCAVIAPETFVSERKAPNLQLRLIWRPIHIGSKISGRVSLSQTSTE